ncbi:carbohydrate ABC transporter permease [Paenibacillus sp. LjRoot56]|uniref:carbohydrate ABC transporter permease n=1 Tax=Paenibacillus sp. LjRoot56 TaxID=3342333 RepID=UPI003ECC97A8
MVRSWKDRTFDTIILIPLLLVGLAALFPILYVVSVSLTPYEEVIKHGYMIIPRSITLEAYKTLLKESMLHRAFLNTIFISVVGTAVNLILTTLLAYPLSRKNVPGRSIILLGIIFTMVFNGGIIPTYLVVKSLGLLNSLWAMIIPNAIWTFNVLIMKSFFESLPEELFESARIDGAKEWRVLLQIVVPLSLPSMMTVGLFYLVGHWNEIFQAIMYVTKKNLQPLQVIVREMLLSSQNVSSQSEVTIPTVSLQMAVVMTASLPIIAIYPFIQKYFTKGMLLGSIKG